MFGHDSWTWFGSAASWIPKNLAVADTISTGTPARRWHGLTIRHEQGVLPFTKGAAWGTWGVCMSEERKRTENTRREFHLREIAEK